jgi:hypothetical protein
MSFGTGWVFVGYASPGQLGFQEGPYLRVVYRPNSQARGNVVPELGDILQILKARGVNIADYRVSGTAKQMISPPLVHDPLTDGDSTGVELPLGALVLVRDVELSGYPGHASSVWCRVSECDSQTDACRKAASEITAATGPS